MVLAFSDSLF